MKVQVSMQTPASSMSFSCACSDIQPQEMPGHLCCTPNPRSRLAQTLHSYHILVQEHVSFSVPVTYIQRAQMPLLSFSTAKATHSILSGVR